MTVGGINNTVHCNGGFVFEIQRLWGHRKTKEAAGECL